MSLVYNKKAKSLHSELTRRIEIREVTNTPGTTGGMETTYNVKTTVWGSIKPLSLSTQIGVYVRDVQVTTAPTHVIRMRVNKELEVTRNGLLGNMYLFSEDTDAKGRSFRIISVIDKEDRGIELLIIVREMGIQYGSDDLL